MRIRHAILSLLLIVSFWPCFAQTKPEAVEKKWWKEAIVYQIYPRSFKDSNGDGIGDLQGIISKLDYIKSLGITAVWINPIYSSPNDDNGYDVSDYTNIMADFGTMNDFDQLLKGLHDRGIKLIMDLVVNHSSNEHEWFKQSRSSRSNPYRDYYHWWNAEQGKPAYRYSLFDVNHDAWKYDSLTNAYYLHYFSRKQPDLNWENPKLRHEVYDIMKFWANKGIDGFRMDAFQYVAKDTTFPGFPKGFESDFNQKYAVQGNLHGYLQEMNKEVMSKYDLMTVAEGSGNTLEDAHNMVDAGRHELNMAYAFDGVGIATPKGFSLLHFKQVFSHWDSAFAKKGWLSIFLANHDQARLVSRFGNDNPFFRDVSAKMLATFVMTMRGTPYWYNGDELGMTNAGFAKISDYKDKAILNEYQHQVNIHGDLQAYLKRIAFEGRDNGRTPFQWDGSANGGFTSGTPWIKVTPNYSFINEQMERGDPNSVLSYFKRLTAARKKYPVLIYGSYALLDKDNPQVYAYTRTFGSKQMLVVLNFSSLQAQTKVPMALGGASPILCNTKVLPEIHAKTITLAPYQAIIYSLAR